MSRGPTSTSSVRCGRVLRRGSAVVARWYAMVTAAVALWVNFLDDREPVDRMSVLERRDLGGSCTDPGSRLLLAAVVRPGRDDHPDRDGRQDADRMSAGWLAVAAGR